LWIIYALLTAFMLATSDAISKKMLAVRDEYLVAWMRLLFALPLLLIILLLIEVPPLDRTFWVASSIALPLEIAAIILYVKALKVSPMSFSIPFLTLTPVFLVVVSYLLLDEKISLIGGAGIFLIASGGYMLNIHKAWGSPLEPVRAILRERGVMMMIAVAFIYSITSSLGKMAIEHSSPLFFGGFYFIVVTILFTPVAIWNNKGKIVIEKKDILPLSVAGFTYSLMIIVHMVALSLTKVAYMISVKRMSIFFSIMYGYLIFRERNIRQRVLGSIVMFAGFLLIVLNP
jgi:drug/metabolite transporter (DMT)-like permease